MPRLADFRAQPATVRDGVPLLAGPDADLRGARFPSRVRPALRFGGRLGSQADTFDDLRFFLDPDTGGSQIPVGPFLGEFAGFAENQRHRGPTHLKFGQSIGDDRWSDAGQGEDLRVAVPHDDRRARNAGQFAESESQSARNKAAYQVGQRLTFDGSGDATADFDRIVAAGQRPASVCTCWLVNWYG